MALTPRAGNHCLGGVGMSEQTALAVDTGAPDHGRMRDHEADLTPGPVVRQALTWIANIHEPTRILDPSAGSGVFGQQARTLWPGAFSWAVEKRGEEKANLKRHYDEVCTGDFRKVIPGMPHEEEPFDLVATNPPFTLFIHLAEHAFRILPRNGVLMLLGLTDVMARARAKVSWCRENPPTYELRIGGAIKFRNGINPNTGKPYTADQRSYSWFAWEMESRTKPGRGWYCEQLQMLASAERRWSVPPGTEVE